MRSAEGSAEKCSGLSASTGCLGGTMAGLEEKRPVSGESTDELAQTVIAITN